MTRSAVHVLALARSGFRQAVRDQVLYVLAGFCILLVLGSVVISSLTVGERGRIVLDLGLSATAVLGTIVAVVVSLTQAARESERRTLDTILAKPVARWEVLLGRFLGMALTLALLMGFMGALHAGELVALKALPRDYPCVLVLTYVETLLVTAMALFLSTFTTTLPCMFISMGFVAIGHWSWGLLMMADRTRSEALRGLLRALHAILPNLDILNARSQLVWTGVVPWSQVGLGLAYGLGYSLLLLVLGAAILSRRDLA